jgi:hypothetical protein
MPINQIRELKEHLMPSKQTYRAKGFQTPLIQTKSVRSAAPQEEEDAPRFPRRRWSLAALFSRKRRRR